MKSTNMLKWRTFLITAALTGAAMSGSAFADTQTSLDIAFDAPESVVAADAQRTTVTTGASAVFTLQLPDGVDPADVNYDNAVLTMTDGDGYYVDEFENPTIALDPSAWVDGSYTFQFDDDAVAQLFTRAQVRGSESDVYSTGGPAWSQFGGNGNGQYYFNLTVTGLSVGDEAVPDATFRVCFYAYGRDASDKARITLTDYINVYDYETEGAQAQTLAEAGVTVQSADAPTWTWVGDDYEGKPVLCDTLQDNFYITWPDGTDASALTASDITITLTGAYGDVLTLNADSDYYVFQADGETQIALPYVYMAFTPVYTNMSISINADAVSGIAFDEAALTASYDIASVYTYQVQHGGLDPNGAVLVYQFYGIDEETLTDWSQIMNGFEYALYLENEDGSRSYYSEENGGSLVDDVESASTYDATGAQDMNIRLWNEAVIYDTTVAVENEDGTLTYRTEDKEVDGEVITLNKELVKGWDGNDLRGVQMTPTQARENGLAPAAGYAFPQSDDFYEKYEQYNFGHDYWVAHSMWPWVEGIEQGWLTNAEDPKANWNGLDKGFGYQYDSDGYYPEWTAPEAEETENWWPWLRSSFPEGMWEAVDAAKAAKYGE